MKNRINASRLAPGLLTFAVLAWMPMHSVAENHFRDVVQITLAYDDLNLSSKAGLTALYGRIQRAAAQVCGDRPSSMELQRSSRWTTCRNDAVANAVTTVNHPGLASLHRRSLGEPESPALAGLSSAE